MATKGRPRARVYLTADEVLTLRFLMARLHGFHEEEPNEQERMLQDKLDRAHERLAKNTNQEAHQS